MSTTEPTSAATTQPVTQRASVDVLAQIHRILDDARDEAVSAALHLDQGVRTALHDGFEAVKEHLGSMGGGLTVNEKVGAAMAPGMSEPAATPTPATAVPVAEPSDPAGAEPAVPAESDSAHQSAP
jgi:hypothetical protein